MRVLVRKRNFYRHPIIIFQIFPLLFTECDPRVYAGRRGCDGELGPRPCPLLGPSVSGGSDSWDSRRWEYHITAAGTCEDNLF